MYSECNISWGPSRQEVFKLLGLLRISLVSDDLLILHLFEVFDLQLSIRIFVSQRKWHREKLLFNTFEDADTLGYFSISRERRVMCCWCSPAVGGSDIMTEAFPEWRTGLHAPRLADIADIEMNDREKLVMHVLYKFILCCTTAGI